MTDQHDPQAPHGMPHPGHSPHGTPPSWTGWSAPPPPPYPYAQPYPYPYPHHPHLHAHPMAQAAAGPSAPAGMGPATTHHHAQHHDLLTGILVGAAAAYLLGNESVQRTVIRSALTLWSTVQGALEETKERFRDAEAELRQAVAEPPPPPAPRDPDGPV